MLSDAIMVLDTVIFGGGAAGLWLLDELARRGTSALLLETIALGSGQTVASQGIIHGGLKYTLNGILSGSAKSIREMPLLWEQCLAGTRQPNLTGTRIRARACHLWRTDSLSSRLGMIGARVGLRVAPHSIEESDRPHVLQNCPGQVALLEEVVISPRSFIEDLANRNLDKILLCDGDRGITFELHGPGKLSAVHLTEPGTNRKLTVHPKHVVFTAGRGNAELRAKSGLSAEAMQRRPLHMVVVRGELPELNGHCVDGAHTRATITSDVDRLGRRVWQIGGQIAEDGVRMGETELVAHAQRELESIVPGIDLSLAEWSTYRVDRAEGTMPGGTRPETVQILHEGNILTAWPTKLALVPILVEKLIDALQPLVLGEPAFGGIPQDWPRPSVAEPPWETATSWHPSARPDRSLRRAA
ncbi:MAG: FAD-dependent oxidoreductase [Planctomycetaceae bacterium]